MPVVYSRRTFQRLCAGAGLILPIVGASPDGVISDKLSSWTKHGELKKYAPAFEYLTKTDFRHKEPGRVDLDGNRMYATLSVSNAKPLDGGKIEAHRKYLDIHYLVAGQEMIGSAPASSLEVSEPYSNDKEVEFFKTPSKYRKISLRPGQFAIFMPGQGHMPGLGADASAVIRKVVVKILV